MIPASHALEESRDENDLAVRARFQDLFVRARGLCERQLAPDDGPERPRFEARDEGGVYPGELLRRGVEDHHAEYGRVARHREARVYLHGPARAYDDDAPAFGDDAEVFVEIHVGEHLKYHVYAAPFGERRQLFEVAGRVMVENVMRALLGDESSPFFSPSRADDVEARGARELHRRRADAAARAVHEYGPARRAPRALEERTVGRRVRRAHARAFGERDARRKRVNL